MSAQQQFERHLAGCSGCTQAVAQWRTFAATTRQAAENQAFRSAAAENLARQQLASSFAQQNALSPFARITGWRGMALAVAVVCLAVVAGIYWQHTHDILTRSRASAPAVVPIVRYSTDGSIRRMTRPRGATISATANEHLVASIGNDRVAVAPAGRMVVRKTGTHSTQLALNHGWIACSVEKRKPGANFVTRTQDKRFEVEVKGTTFGVQYQDSVAGAVDASDLASPLLQVAVTEGIVAVRETQRRQWIVNAGEQLVVQRDGMAMVTPVTAMNRSIVAALLNPTATSGQMALYSGYGPPAASTRSEKGVAGESTERPEKSRSVKLSSRRGKGLPIAETGVIPIGVIPIDKMKQWIGTGREKEAIAVLEAQLVTDPGNSELWRLLAEAKRKSGDYKNAIVAYQQVIDLASPQVANAARYKMGLIYQNQFNDPANAILQFSSYLSAGGPQLLRAEALYHLGKAEFGVGNREMAQSHLREVVARHGATAAAVQAKKLLQKMDAAQQ